MDFFNLSCQFLPNPLFPRPSGPTERLMEELVNIGVRYIEAAELIVVLVLPGEHN